MTEDWRDDEMTIGHHPCGTDVAEQLNEHAREHGFIAELAFWLQSRNRSMR